MYRSDRLPRSPLADGRAADRGGAGGRSASSSVAPPAVALLRRSRRRVYLLGCLGLGGLLVPSWAFALFEWRSHRRAGLRPGRGVRVLSSRGLVLAFVRAWSFWVGVVLGGVRCSGWAAGSSGGSGRGTDAVVKSLRGLEFVRPEWLVLLVFVPLVVLISRRSLSGLGPTRKWIAITPAGLVVACLAMALAEPRIRRPSEHVTVLFVVDRSFSVPQDLDPDQPATEAVDRRWEQRAAVHRGGGPAARPDSRHDQAGLILFGKRPRLALPPSAAGRCRSTSGWPGPIDGNYTDIAAAIKLALASFPEGTGKRIVLVSDGNENIGNAEEQANLAKQNGVQIDAIALAPGFRNENEVLVQAVEAPPVTRSGAAAADPRAGPQRHPGPGGGRPARSPQVVARREPGRRDRGRPAGARRSAPAGEGPPASRG